MSDEITTEQFVSGLRELAEFYEAHPELPLPQEAHNGLNIYSADSKEEVEPIVRAFGSCDKAADDDLFRFTRQFGRLKLTVVAFRNELCERVVVGTQKVKKQIEVVSAITEEQEVTEEVVEWRCPEILRPPTVAVEG